MFEKVSRSLKYDSNIFFVHKHIYIFIGERAKRARHSQVCSIENRGYIIYILGMCSFQHKWASERQLYLFVLLHHVIMK